MKEIIILTIFLLMNIPIIYFAVISLFFKEIFPSDGDKASYTGSEGTSENGSTSPVEPTSVHSNPDSGKIPMTPLTIIKAIILIAFIIGLFAGEIILIDKLGTTFFDYHFIQNLLGFSLQELPGRIC